MKKLLCLVFVMALLMLSACSQPNEPYKFERKEIAELSVSDGQNNPITLSNLKMMRLLDMIEALEPKATENYDDTSRKHYCLDIADSAANQSQICLTDEYITIDGYVYDVTDYSPNEFASFFNDTNEHDDRVPYKIKRNTISKIEGNKQGSSDKIELSDTAAESLLDIIDGFNPKATDWYNYKKGGWHYFFTVYYEDGSKSVISINYSDITIDGYIYDVDNYNYEIFSNFFETD